MTDFRTSDRDVDRAIRSWLHEDRHEDASRIAGAVLDLADTTPQRRTTWWPARRTPTMNKIVGLGLAAAAVVAVVLIGSQLFGSPGGLGSQATPTPEPTATAEPTPAGLLPEGPHALWLAGSGVPVTVTIAAPDWYGEPDGGILTKHDSADPPDGAGMIVFPGGEYYVHGDPCQWSTTRPDTPVTTVDEFVAALVAQASRDASAPVDVTVDGYAGKSIVLHVPEDAVFDECDHRLFGSFAVGADPTPSRFHQGPGQIDKLWIVDVDGQIVVIDIAYYEGTPQAVVDEMEAIVASIAFE